jgi:hypothetical protein
MIAFLIGVFVLWLIFCLGIARGQISQRARDPS